MNSCVFRWGGSLWLGVGLAVVGADRGGAQAKDWTNMLPPAEQVAFRQTAAELGYHKWLQHADGWVIFGKPYDRKATEKVLAKAAQTDLQWDGRHGYLTLLICVVQFQGVPPADLRDVIRPAVARVVEDLAKGPQDRDGASLTLQAQLCLWNVDYALAWGEAGKNASGPDEKAKADAAARLESLEQLALERRKLPHTAHYDGSLVIWWRRQDPDVAEPKLARLAASSTWDPQRTLAGARAELPLRRQLRQCRTADEAAQSLLAASKNPQLPLPTRAWAVRTLADYPTEAAVRHLLELFDSSRRGGSYELGLEAQEALRRLKKIPENAVRYAYE